MNATIAILGVAIICAALTMISILDASRREFAEPYMKALWILIAAIPVLGFIAWFAIGRKKAIPPSGAPLAPE